MEVAEKLRIVRLLLERARCVSDAERAWLLALAWSQLQEGADALERACAAVTVPTCPGAVPGPPDPVC
jgi:hypothetical protein